MEQNLSSSLKIAAQKVWLAIEFLRHQEEEREGEGDPPECSQV